MKFAIFWRLSADLTRKEEQELTGEMLSKLPEITLDVEFLLRLGPHDGVTVVESDDITTMWKALDPYLGRVDFNIRPAVYYSDLEAFLRQRQELLEKADEWFEQLPPELRENSSVVGAKGGSSNSHDQ